MSIPIAATSGAVAVEAAPTSSTRKAQLDIADIERQIAWYKAHGQIDKSVSAREVVDPSFVK